MKIRAALKQGWRAAGAQGRAVLVEASLPARLSAQALARAWMASTTQRPFFLLETPSGPRSKRFSLLAGEPLFVLEGRGRRAWVVRGATRVPLMLPPEKALARLGRALKAQGGPVPLVGALSYEAGARYEAWRLPKAEPLGLPDWLWALPSRWAVQAGLGAPWRFTELAPSKEFLGAIAKSLKMTPAQLAALASEAAPAHFEGWLQGLWQRALEPLPYAPLKRTGKAKITDSRHAGTYGRMVEKAQADIAAGEYYQANLSHRLSAALNAEPFQFYQRLLAESPSPMSAYVDLGHAQVCSASPERLFRQRGAAVDSWPIAGTAPNRGRAGERAALRASAKDSAEHVMLVDLQRNDLGRVCVPGSVKVPRFKTVESYAHVHHLVSQVRGRLAPGKDFSDLLQAGFPGGSISGAPKPRVLQAIADLEGQRRGWYTGGLGYWYPASERADFNLLIRSAIAKDGRLTWSVGSGIVADSVAKKEWAETLAKGKAIQRSLGREPVKTLGLNASIDLTGRPALAESLPFRAGKPLHLRLHLLRLAEGCRALAWPDPDLPAIEKACLRGIQASRLKDGSLRLRYWAGWEGEEPQFLVQPLAQRPLPKAWRQGLRLMTTAVRHYGAASLQGRLKANAMLANWLASAESQAWAEDGLRLTPDGLVAEGVWSNIVARKGRIVRTPPLHLGVLEGVTRAQLLARFGRNYEVREEPLTRYDLWTADEVWVCSSLRGPLKVREVDGRPIGLLND